ADPFISNTQILEGTPANDVLIGGSGPDVLEGGPGADEVTGGFGADTFVLPFGGPSVDTFVDFNPSEDRIQINDVPQGSKVAKAFKGRTSSSKGLVTVEGKKEAKFAESPYIYDADSGRLFFNANGDKKGFGKAGGVIAQLTPGLDLNGSDLVISYVDPLG
ncbi:MAG: hypothetical protein VKJ66_09680, partial [Synechococcus sp.]|nr:hypothetical protein [Synechococcus sp.]